MLSQTGLKEGEPHRCASPRRAHACVCLCVCVLLFNERNINRLFQINFPNPSFLCELVAVFKHIDFLGGGWRGKGRREPVNGGQLC